MKKNAALLLISLITISLFAQTKVDEKKIGKTLEANEDASAVFTCSMKLSGMKTSNDGIITLPALAKNKIKIISGMDLTNIAERLKYANKKKYLVTFVTTDFSSKTYSITKIDGIETVEEFKARERLAKLAKQPVQVLNLEIVNLGASETAWLPGQVQDKLKSNFQEYLGLKIVVDSKSEQALKKLQAESEDNGRDESSAIELGKITTAQFAVFTKLRKTGSGYTISIDFTDLTTGEQIASCSSKEYSKPEYLYGSTGAVDELTLALANKLNIKISDLNKNLLTSGSADFSVDAQLALAKQNEEQYQKMLKDYDAELSRLMTSNDINAIQNKNRIEAEKALLVEKQNAEKKRQEELRAQLARAAEDEKLEAERSIALKTQRDQMAKEAASKAAEVRKLKMEKQGVLGQINVIESKKKALVEIRWGVEARNLELHDQMVLDRLQEEARLRDKAYSTVELDSDFNPTEQAIVRREKQVIKSYEDLTNKFFADCASVKKATESQDTALLAEIRSDQKALSAIRTVSSLGEELKVSYGNYDGSRNGWNACLSVYSDGILLYTDTFILNYEALSGKEAPDMAKELDDAVIEEYTNNVDMYSSLLTRGDPIVYFELDYNVTVEGDDKPSQYKFNFLKIRVINTISGKVTQTSALNKVESRTMKPEWDLSEIEGIVAQEKAAFENQKKEFEIQKNLYSKYYQLRNSQIKLADYLNFYKEVKDLFVKIPGKDFAMMKTEVPESLYETVIAGNIESFKEDIKFPKDSVTWHDAVKFCNLLSEIFGFTPVYVDDPKAIDGISKNDNANGFRLPTGEEWVYAAKGGQDYKYSGSDSLDEVGWFYYSSDRTYRVHPVAQKKANDYGLYDMSGNLSEWCWGAYDANHHYVYGGNWHSGDDGCRVTSFARVASRVYLAHWHDWSSQVGFRIVSPAF